MLHSVLTGHLETVGIKGCGVKAIFKPDKGQVDNTFYNK